MWEAIVANRRRSAILIAGMAAILFIVGYAGGEAFAFTSDSISSLAALIRGLGSKSASC